METKKNEKYDLERKRPLFFGFGMIFALSLAITAFEWKTEIEPIVGCDFNFDEWERETTIVVTRHEVPEPPKPKVEREPVSVVKPEDDFQKSEKKPVLEPTIVEVPTTFTPIESIPVEVAEEAPFVTVEEMPSFAGGFQEFYKLLGSKINYPNRAIRIGAEGKVFVKFIVEKDGSLSNFEVIKGIGSGCDLEALRVMKLVPNFEPGKQRGVPVRVQMVVPINFQLK